MTDCIDILLMEFSQEELNSSVLLSPVVLRDFINSSFELCDLMNITLKVLGGRLSHSIALLRPRA